MTKALRHIPESQRMKAATRRLQGGIYGQRGSGFWAAKDYFDKKGLRLPGDLGTQQTLSEAMKRMESGSNFSMADTGPDRKSGKLPRRQGRFNQGGSRPAFKKPRETNKFRVVKSR